MNRRTLLKSLAAACLAPLAVAVPRRRLSIAEMNEADMKVIQRRYAHYYKADSYVTWTEHEGLPRVISVEIGGVPAPITRNLRTGACTALVPT